MARLSSRFVRIFVSLAVACVLSGFNLTAQVQTGVTAVIPNGRRIDPAGNWIPLAPYPFGIAVTRDGREAAIPSIGFPFALNLIEDPASPTPRVERLPAVSLPAPQNKHAGLDVHAGLAFSPDGSILWVATGDAGSIQAYQNTATNGPPQLTPAYTISLNGPTDGATWSASFAVVVISSPDGKTHYALDQGNWRVVVIDVATRSIIASIPTGRYPFALALSPHGRRLYVTNTGLFEYTEIPGANIKDPLHSGLRFPPFGYPSAAAPIREPTSDTRCRL